MVALQVSFQIGGFVFSILFYFLGQTVGQLYQILN